MLCTVFFEFRTRILHRALKTCLLVLGKLQVGPKARQFTFDRFSYIRAELHDHTPFKTRACSQRAGWMPAPKAKGVRGANGISYDTRASTHQFARMYQAVPDDPPKKNASSSARVSPAAAAFAASSWVAFRLS